MSDKLLDLDEVSKILGKPEATIKRYARENLLTNVGEDDEFKFKEDEVNRYLEFAKRLG
ncbi:helix-turn-helix domain-containing protein [Shewanella eurypsychrophilus]|uniref:Helix-turn-helix domain-containing protein n=1 Tax=Shewanella eurypsychrophilus TaxID=2593656 RepID=A0ABX6VAV1_9GAMM|nr:MULTISPECIES: helix-turn-helix domain-containing protein [Shewanella]QFU24382.1 DNA-binding protein [Shewanella sp. YLB-09]QPG59582.1 helix-turn-helix domain-containing protein [Shewanella eurypsychrophilus]